MKEYPGTSVDEPPEAVVVVVPPPPPAVVVVVVGTLVAVPWRHCE